MSNILVNYKMILTNNIDTIYSIIDCYTTELPQLKNNKIQIQKAVTEKLTEFSPSIMFYGIYNAGKSSLLNAIMGEEVARVADIPTTDRVDYYEWNGYKLADTPGVNAPMAHELVTEEHLRTSDVVIFVMNTTGSFEYEDNYVRMASIIKSGKKIILVLNDKKGYDTTKQDDFDITNNIKRKIFANMHNAGIEANIHDIENKYSIIMVNALRALKGKKQNIALFLEQSNIRSLESAILAELKRVDALKILHNTAVYVEQELNNVKETLAKLETSEDIQKFNKFVSKVHAQKLDIKSRMASFVDMQGIRFEKELYNSFSSVRSANNGSGQENSEKIIATKVAIFSDSIQKEFAKELLKTQDILEVDYKYLTESIKQLSGQWALPNNESVFKKFDSNDSYLETEQSAYISNDSNGRHIANAKIGIKLTKMTAEHAFKIAAKAGYPQLARIIGVAIPYIAPIVFTVLVLCCLYNSASNNAEHEKNLRLAEKRNASEQKRVQEEMQAMQELRTVCERISYEVTNSIKESVDEEIESIIGNILVEIDSSLKVKKDTSLKLMNNLNTLNDCQGNISKLKLDTY